MFYNNKAEKFGGGIGSDYIGDNVTITYMIAFFVEADEGGAVGILSSVLKMYNTSIIKIVDIWKLEYWFR